MANTFRPSEVTYLKVLLGIFRIFGLVTFKLVASGKKPTQLRFAHSTPALLYNLLYASITSLVNYLTLLSLYQTRYNKTLTLFHIVDLFELLLGTCVAVFILLYYCLHRGTLASAVSRIHAVSSTAGRIGGGGGDKSTFRQIAASTMFHLLVVLALLVSGLMYFHSFVYLLSITTRNTVITWFILQYSFVVKVLQGAFGCVNRALEQLAAPPIELHALSRSTTDGRRQLLSTVHELHLSLMAICQEVAGFYKITILGSIAYVFISMVVLMYFLIDLVIERKVIFSVIEYVHLLLWLVCFTSSFIALARHVTKITEEIERTGMIVHRPIKRCSLSDEVTKELKDFSLYLIHVRVKYTAWGFFSLDGTLVHSIFSSITTYLVILLQFQLE